MDKNLLEKRKEQLKTRRERLELALELIEQRLTKIENMEKPFVANVSAYSGHYSMQYKTEEQARKKLNEYASKEYFKLGLNYGVYLYKWNEDGTKTLLESIPMGRKNFKPKMEVE